jgi:lysophospholipid acyltransferase (LPLAT)-like uncharacterized protein
MSQTPETPPPLKPATEVETRSSRSLTPARLRLYRLSLPIALLLVRFWWWSCRIVRVVGDEHAAASIAKGAIIPVYWHQHQLFCVRYLMNQKARGLVPGFLISPSVDGELPAMVAKHYGTRVLRGSSTATGARTLRDYYVALQEGVSPAITVDGPYGPRYECKPGPILLSQMSGKPIVPLAFFANRAWQFRAWDRFVLPWPFARIAIAVGEPRYVPKGLDAVALQRWQKEIDAELHSLYKLARASLAKG